MKNTLCLTMVLFAMVSFGKDQTPQFEDIKTSLDLMPEPGYIKSTSVRVYHKEKPQFKIDKELITLFSYEYSSIEVLGELIYFDAILLEEEKHARVVHPEQYDGPVLEFYVALLHDLLKDKRFSLEVDPTAEEYFMIDAHPMTSPIEPFECKHTNHNKTVHHINPQDESSPCHGKQGDNGSCEGTFSDSGIWNLKCIVPDRTTMRDAVRCFTTVQCPEKSLRIFKNGKKYSNNASIIHIGTTREGESVYVAPEADRITIHLGNNIYVTECGDGADSEN